MSEWSVTFVGDEATLDTIGGTPYLSYYADEDGHSSGIPLSLTDVKLLNEWTGKWLEGHNE